jgi:hypothetical protein
MSPAPIPILVAKWGRPKTQGAATNPKTKGQRRPLFPGPFADQTMACRSQSSTAQVNEREVFGVVRFPQ